MTVRGRGVTVHKAWWGGGVNRYLETIFETGMVDFSWFVMFYEHQNFMHLEFTQIIVLLVHYTISFGFNLFGITRPSISTFFTLRFAKDY